MKILASILALLFVCTPLSRAEEGFTTIFDGKDLSKIKTTGNWKIQKDGSLYLDPRPGEKGWTRYGSYLWLKDDYKDFVFDFEYKHGKGGNSGLYFRIYDESDATAHGFEIQILDCFGKKKLGQHDLGGVIRTAGPLVNASKPAGEWNRMVIECLGDEVKVWVNGDFVNHGSKCTAQKGKIAIQAEGSEVEFRKLDLTPINALTD